MKSCYCKLIIEVHHIESEMENIDSENNSSNMVNNKLTLKNSVPIKSKIVQKNLNRAGKKQKMTKIVKPDKICKKLLKSYKNTTSKDGEQSGCIIKQKRSKKDDNIITLGAPKTLNCQKHKKKCLNIHIHI